MELTDEQRVISEHAERTSENILINALAGAAKTFQLVLIASAKGLRGTPILAICFNKRSALDLQGKMPSNVLSATVNSVGHKAWAGHIRKHLNLDTKKTYNILTQEVQAGQFDKKSLEEFYETFADTLRAIALCKHSGYIPSGKFDNIQRLITPDAMFDSIEDEFGYSLSSMQISLIDRVITRTILQGFDGTIDFDDQIYLPTLFGGQWPKFPLVLVDEAQDLSRLNHVMLRRLVTKRIIAVGDPHQSIYAFRGADHNSMANLKLQFGMREMYLSTSFRCPRSAVRLVKQHAPMMQSAPDAIEGIIRRHQRWTLDLVPENATILCRNNGPLFNLAIKFLKARRGVKLLGAEIGPGMVRVLKKFGPLTMKQDAVLEKLDKYTAERLLKAKNPENVIDYSECLKVFITEGQNLAEAIAFAQHTFKSEGTITLATGHKVKGLEYDIVFFLDSWRIPSKHANTHTQLQQEANVDYVIKTRWKKELHFIDMEKLQESL